LAKGRIEVRGGFAWYVKSRLSAVFGPRGWPEWLGGILLGIVNILFLALAHKPFSIYTGFYNWGSHIYQALGAGFSKAVEPILANVTSAGDIGLFLGAFTAALLAGEVALRKPARLLDYGEAALGGLLMALGVIFARGCNWGGFFSAITALSLHGYIMMIGLLIGGYIGALYVEWRARREEVELELELLEAPQAMADGGYPTELRAPSSGFPYRLAGLAAAATLLAVLLWAASAIAGPVTAGAILLGFMVGVVLQRARFCFATAFRDILRGSGEFERSVRLQIGIALGIMVGATGAAALKYMGYVPADAYVKPASPLGILGGILFGIGMVLAGGCASGSLWRAAEGHVKLWVALLAAVLSYVPLKNALSGLVGGTPVPLFKLGWAEALALVYASMVAWIVFVLYLEYRRRWSSNARA
jgi:hypothetical protein